MVATSLEGREHMFRLSDGRHITVATYGDDVGDPVLMLHGIPGSRLMFAPADEHALARGLRLICPDRPGIGGSSRHRGRTLASFADDLTQVLDAMGIGRLALFGVSGGAPYATLAAAALGARVQMLALVNPMGPVRDVAPERLPLASRAFFLWFGQRALLRDAVAHAVARQFHWAPVVSLRSFARLLGEPDRTILLRPEMVDHIVRDVGACLLQGVGGAAEDLALFGRPWGLRYGAVTAPVIVWQGSADRIVPVAAAAELAQRLASAELKWIDGAGHFWFYDHMALLLDEVRRRIDAS